MGILFICSCISWILGPSVYVHIKTFFNFSYLVTINSVDVLHFTLSGIHNYFCINCREKYVNERYYLGARNDIDSTCPERPGQLYTTRPSSLPVGRVCLLFTWSGPF